MLGRADKTRLYQATLCAAAIAVSAAANAGPTGKELFENFVAATPIYDDKELAHYVGNLVGEIVQVSEMKGERFTFTLLDDPGVNAFATRDNYVYVNRGLLLYVNNEAQLVSVLAHEVAHVTEGHVNGMESKASGAQILAALAAMLSGSNEVYEAGMAYANSLIRGHGRNNELEADRTGARYMAELGYDPQELIEMLSTMKDMENLQKARARASGAPTQTYHGIFASHPRNDSRLRNAVSKAALEESSGTRGNGAERYRQMTEGLVWGENFQEKEQKPERYSNSDLRVRFDFPEGWSQEEDAQTQSVSGSPESAEASLSMRRMARTTQSPEEYLYNYLDSPILKDGQAIEPARLKGFTGILPGEDGKPDQRIAVVYYKLNAFIFTGEVDEQEKFEEFDELFVDSINTFRPISGREIRGQAPKRIHWIQAEEGTTFDALAEELRLTGREKDELRLINGFWPAGEPEKGRWIKIFKQDDTES